MSNASLLQGSTQRMLGSLAGILRKGADHAAKLNVPDCVFLDYRLYPDMFPLSRQVQIACDQPARGAARLAGVQLPSFPDTETTFAQLIERCTAANNYVKGIPADAIDSRHDADITFPIGGGAEMTMKAGAFLQDYILPNLYFHAATAYNILRHNGVPLGKKDFLRPE